MKVAAAGELEARDEFFGNGGTADEVAALENGDREAGAGKIGGSGETIVAAADHQRIPFLLIEQRARRVAAAAAQVPSPHPFLPHCGVIRVCLER